MQKGGGNQEGIGGKGCVTSKYWHVGLGGKISFFWVRKGVLFWHQNLVPCVIVISFRWIFQNNQVQQHSKYE